MTDQDVMTHVCNPSSSSLSARLRFSIFRTTPVKRSNSTEIWTKVPDSNFRISNLYATGKCDTKFQYSYCPIKIIAAFHWDLECKNSLETSVLLSELRISFTVLTFVHMNKKCNCLHKKESHPFSLERNNENGNKGRSFGCKVMAENNH